VKRLCPPGSSVGLPQDPKTPESELSKKDVE